MKFVNTGDEPFPHNENAHDYAAEKVAKKGISKHPEPRKITTPFQTPANCLIRIFSQIDHYVLPFLGRSRWGRKRTRTFALHIGLFGFDLDL
jgi:hypothetical protein